MHKPKSRVLLTHCILNNLIVNAKHIPQKNGSHERRVYCSPASPDGPHPPHFATSVPILQHSGNHRGNAHSNTASNLLFVYCPLLKII